MGSHEVVEHTADVGVTATGATTEEVFTEVTLGLLEITGTARPGEPGTEVTIELGPAPDLGALLVDWLGEVLYHQDARDSLITSVEVMSIGDHGLRGRIGVRPRGDEVPEGTPVKAVTYHQLVVELRDGVWTAQVFFDI